MQRPATGFPSAILAGPEEECRLAATEAPATAEDPREAAPQVLTVCSAEDGALTATAFHEGEQLWQSDPSPAGTWTVRLDQGRVLAEGTETGTDVPGEIVASEARAAWSAPGGEGVAQAAAFTARIGIDGAAMVVTNEAGQLLGYDTAEGTNLWTLPLTAPGTPVRGTLEAGTAVVLGEVVREEPLDLCGAPGAGARRREREVSSRPAPRRSVPCTPGRQSAVTVGRGRFCSALSRPRRMQNAPDLRRGQGRRRGVVRLRRRASSRRCCGRRTRRARGARR